jgi:1-deoxy-D-xylulose-5-phosphate reductoisomerase|tara:strand:- start:2337 stop:3497 length:1161 start_codon:yes stop_codon:yes gene_type:complete
VRSLSILGSTGSIGCSTLDVVRLHPDRFNIFALSSYTNTDLLLAQAIEFRPSVIVTKDEISAKKIYALLKNVYTPEILYGINGYRSIASADEPTDVVAAISGSAGLLPTMDAIMHGKRILLANKESMVMAGPLMMGLCSKFNAKIIPVDSEHNAIFQIIHNNLNNNAISKIILTASGGPFRNFTRDQLSKVTVEAALNHPNWVMGKKITIDSATMMNKGLEVIEAAYLFDIPIDKINVLIHPQSIIHSFVEYLDGSLISQLGYPDMRIPISYALGFPDRIKSGVEGIKLEEAKDLTFESPDNNLFPCLKLAYQAFSSGMASTIILNAANEVAVDAFLRKIIPFIEIPILIDSVLQSWVPKNPNNIDDILSIDTEARIKAQSLIPKS